MKTREPDIYPLLVLALAALGSVRIMTLHDIYLDDNCWVLSTHIASGLQDFLANGFSQLQREPLGTFLYLFYFPYRLIGDQALLIWHGLTLAVQMAIPLVLYYFVRNLTDGRRDIAGFVAMALIVTGLDQTTPFLAAINYRIGLLLGLLSLYLTERAIHGIRIDRKKIALALLISGIGEYIFMEGVIAFEPGRLLLLWFVRLRFDKPASTAIKRALVAWIPFVAITIPLIAYKLLLRPFGAYTGIYSTGLEHFADWTAVSEMLQLFLLGHWLMLQDFAMHRTPMTILLALVASAVTLFIFMRSKAQRTTPLITASAKPSRNGGGRINAPQFMALTGIILLVCQIGFFGFAGRFPGFGDRTTHAILMQPGYAMIVGTGAWWLIDQFILGSLKIKPLLPNMLLALFVGVGIYFSNLNLDLYAAASKRGDGFWQAFTKRFPSLPEKADFLIDAAPPPYIGGKPTFFGAEGLHGSCGYELHLDLLYPGNDDTTMSRRYRVVPVRHLAQAYRQYGPAILKDDLKLTSNFGTELLRPADIIVVFYRDGELLVNNEILKRYPAAPYRPWTDKPPPSFGKPLPHEAR